jgi:hypothetical protein
MNTSTLTIVFAQAAKVFVQVKPRRTVAELDVGQPFGDDVEESGV